MRIGLFGGTFDPIHVGHLVLATVAMEEGKLDRVIFMPAGLPPHKVGKHIAAPQHRLNMVKLAAGREPRFQVSDWELSKEEVSYTIDTVKWMRKQYPQDELFFIIGADMLADFPTWHAANEILQIVTLLAVPRPGFGELNAQQVWEQLPEHFRRRVQIVDMPEMEIASTWIRSRIQSGKSIHYLVPLQVEDYIIQHHLYEYRLGIEQTVPVAANDVLDQSRWIVCEQQIREYAMEQLSPYRFRHVEGVVQSAVELAKKYGVDERKIRVAAWLHDVAREWEPERLLAEADRLGIEQIFYIAVDLLHGPIAAKLAGEKFGLFDPEITQAVKYHTCGRAAMTVFEKVLCLADAIEPSRVYPGVDQVRRLAFNSLEKALAVQFDGTIAYLLQRNKPICVNTLLARNEWWQEVAETPADGARTNGNNS
ncbi:MAG: hypothetical protein JWN30_345 [Bacilli bacterium]|nr:hypothetical protein [Bacilli bacterium]